ncbi:phosphoethanolamine transferase [Campylobacter majalis]|uniref:phosphoethanolamine transferase n=1 Tax=Campylobacter majalis TaxID=2790656 RepID=UPI003D694BB0
MSFFIAANGTYARKFSVILLTCLIIAVGGGIWGHGYRYFVSLFSIFVLLFIPFSIFFYDANLYYHINVAQAFCLCVSLILLILISFLKSKIFLALVALLVGCIALIYGGYFAINGEPLASDALIATLQTNRSEAYEYLATHQNFSLYLVSFVIVSLLFIFIKTSLGLKFNKSKKIFIFSISIVLMLCVFNVHKFITVNNIYSIYGIDDTIKHFELMRKFKENYKNRMALVDGIKSDEDGVFVLVIGESQNRNYMSVYGYNEPTTPFLNELKNDKNAIFFTNAHSNHTHTAPVLNYALTSKNQYNKLDFELSPSILDVANKLAFKTVWISNQPKFGLWGAAVSDIAVSAKDVIFTSTQEDEYVRPDEVILPKLKQMAIEDKMLIIIHLMGNHSSYIQRYPREFAKFGKGLLNEYKNSVFYSDFVLSEILKTVKKFKNFKALVYLSDHSEAVGNGDHDSARFRYEMTQIPFFVYFSLNYQSEKVVQNLRENKDKFWTNDLLFEVLSSMMGVKNIQIDLKNDITSEFYDDNISRFMTLHSKIFFTDVISK